MKKLVVAILLLVYFTVSSGFVVSLHYCMDRFDSARIGDQSSDECGNCGMHNGKQECCWDDVKMLKLHTDHLVSKALTVDFTVPVPKQVTHEYLLSPLVSSNEITPTVAHGPPLPGEDICLKFCVFRI
jgi:hypothetical protein